MQIEHWKLSDIKPYDNNPRVNDSGVDAVATSIREFGFRQPIVVDEQGVIIVGHTRYKAAVKLGLETVLCVTVTWTFLREFSPLRKSDFES